MTAGRNAPEDRFDADVLLRFPDGRTYEGPVIDLRGVDNSVSDSPQESPPPDPSPLSPSALRRAIRAGRPAPADAPTVRAPTPGPVHAHVALLAPDEPFARRPALAAVAIARGIDTPRDDELAAARRSLRASKAGAVGASELREARRRAAEAGSETERLRERVATVRGRVNALREAAGDGDGIGDGISDDGVPLIGDDDAREALEAAESSLSAATRRLSEVATERVAAAQRLSLLESRARGARDERDARLRLEDRVGNLERAVRDARVAAVEGDFRDARRFVASRAERGTFADPASSADSSPVSADLLDALAVVRIAPIRAPVVVAGGAAGALGGPESAFELLDAPLVVR